jgi:integrase
MTTPAGHSLVFLAEASVKPETNKRYAKAIKEFIAYTDKYHIKLDSLTSIDYAAAAFTVDLYFGSPDHARRQTADNLACGLKLHLPEAKNGLPFLAKCLKGWKRLKPSTSWLPLPYELAALVAASLVRAGKHDYATAVMTAFSGLLRGGELLDLRGADVALPGDARLKSLRAAGGLHIRQAKTGKDQFALLRHDWVATMLGVHLKQANPGPNDKIFTFNAEQLRSALASALQTLGIRSSTGRGIVVHSLRHGGATDMLLQGLPVADVLRHGRWRQTSSAEIYLQTGQALRFDTIIPPSAAALANRVVANPLRAMAAASRQFLLQQRGLRAKGGNAALVRSN